MNDDLGKAFSEIVSAGSIEIEPAEYPELFRLAIAETVVRRPEKAVRVRIFGPLEARLQSVDRLVLGGLVEGVWPPETRSDPWLNRPMRHELGLDLPERRIGLSAHDLAQSLGAREVILTRAAKIAGAPTVASRFVQRLAAVAGERPQIVTSDAADASRRIAAFAAGEGAWLVSVLMVSEGVDIPRLRVGVYATTARTELFFRQVVGRFVRRTPVPRAQMSHVYLPSDPVLKRLATQIEEERDHALVAQSEGEAIERGERGEPGDGFHALWSSARADDDVLQTTQPGDALQLFADPSAPAPVIARPAPPEPTAFERREHLRAERRALVAAIARRTGEGHAAINARVNRETGAPSVAKATEEQLEHANRLLEREATRR
jgi:hypothetical protein